MILGRNLIVNIDGVPVAGSKSCQFQISQNFISVCPPTARRVFNKKPTTYDWSMSVDCLIPSSTLSVSLVDKLIEGTRVLLTFTDGSGQNRAGFAYVKSCDEGGSVGSLATFSAYFESDGALYKCEMFGGWDIKQEGAGCELYVDQQDELSCRFEQPKKDIGMLNFDGHQSGKLYIFSNTTWAIYSYSAQYIWEWLYYQEAQNITNNAIVFAQGNYVWDYDADYFQDLNIIANDNARLILLYE